MPMSHLHDRDPKREAPEWCSGLFDMYYGKLFVFACHMVFREDVAKDIVQDVFISIYEKSVSVQEMVSWKTYLYRSVRNRCYNYLRDRKVEDRRLALYAEACLAADSVEVIEEPELVGQIRNFLAQLPEQCSAVCRMRLFEELTFEEIAQQLHITESTVRVQLHRGIKKLQALALEQGATSSMALILAMLA